METDILSIYCKDDATYYTFDGFWDNNCQACLLLFNDSLKWTCKYCVDGSICQFIFPKVVLAHISGEVGPLYWNRFIFDRHSLTEPKVARLLRHGVIVHSVSVSWVGCEHQSSWYCCCESVSFWHTMKNEPFHKSAVEVVCAVHVCSECSVGAWGYSWTVSRKTIRTDWSSTQRQCSWRQK